MSCKYCVEGRTSQTKCIAGKPCGTVARPSSCMKCVSEAGGTYCSLRVEMMATKQRGTMGENWPLGWTCMLCVMLLRQFMTETSTSAHVLTLLTWYLSCAGHLLHLMSTDKSWDRAVNHIATMSCTLFPGHCSQFFLSFNAVYFELLVASLTL